MSVVFPVTKECALSCRRVDATRTESLCRSAELPWEHGAGHSLECVASIHSMPGKALNAPPQPT